MSEINQIYRASIAGIIIDNNDNFLFVQLVGAREEEWDFVKGGMHSGENENETLAREIREELGDEFRYEQLRRSEWNIIYEWPEELQIRKGFRGQARISYWIRYIGGPIKLQANELQTYKWVNIKDLKEFMLKSHFPLFQYEIFERDYFNLKK